MSTLAQQLRRFPVLFDYLNRFNRQLRGGSVLFRELVKFLPPHEPFTFLQIGANDGISTDPFREFMIRPNVRGITVEPVPEYFDLMQASYVRYPNVIPENHAIGYPSAHLPFYAYSSAYLASKGGTPDLAGLAGFSREKLEVCLLPGDDPATCIQEILIPVRTIEEVMYQHGFPSFDCLFIDCEGHEDNILTNLDYAQVNPRLIVFEHTHHVDRIQVIDNLLMAKGFSLKRLEFDTIASR